MYAFRELFYFIFCQLDHFPPPTLSYKTDEEATAFPFIYFLYWEDWFAPSFMYKAYDEEYI